MSCILNTMTVLGLTIVLAVCNPQFSSQCSGEPLDLPAVSREADSLRVRAATTMLAGLDRRGFNLVRIMNAAEESRHSPLKGQITSLSVPENACQGQFVKIEVTFKTWHDQLPAAPHGHVQLVFAHHSESGHAILLGGGGLSTANGSTAATSPPADGEPGNGAVTIGGPLTSVRPGLYVATSCLFGWVGDEKRWSLLDVVSKEFSVGANPDYQALVGRISQELNDNPNLDNELEGILGQIDVDDAVLERVAKLDRVTTLRLRDQPVTGKGIKALIPLERLNWIDLGGTLIDDGVVPTLSQIRGLRSVSLARTNLSSESLRGLAECRDLEELDLGEIVLTQQAVSTMATLPRLAVLKLANTWIDDASLEAISHCSALKVLDLTNTLVTDAGMAHLERLPALERLIISGTGVGDKGLARLAGCKSLREVEAARTNVTAGAKKILPRLVIEN